ncbi:MAG: thiamine phosphate synthase [Candidatus Acidiferrales bacterium]
MARRLPRFCAILDRALEPQRPLEEWARLLSEAGVRWVQLRSKRATSALLLEETRRLLAVLPAETRLVVNDRADVALLAGAAGVHVGQDDLPASEARKILGPQKLIGLSTHTPEQVEAARQEPVDYVAVGPIFSTSTKSDTQPVIGLEGLRQARRLTEKPLVAIGGITAGNAAAVLAAGADAVAVISGWQATPDVQARLQEFRRVLGGLD